MLGKLRLRFILIGASSFAVVAILLILSINIANYVHTTARHDETLGKIHEYNEKFPEGENGRTPITDMPWTGHEGEEFTLRFFSLECSKDGEILIFDDAYISSIDEDDAREYAKATLDRHKSAGYYLDYRYLVSEDEETETIEIIFLNVADANDARKTLIKISCVVGAVGLLLASLLVTLFSGYAIRPYVRNMEQQKRFITDAGHELKTPVTSISTSADILAMENGENEWISNIQKQSSYLAGLILNLVQLSKFDEGKNVKSKENFSLSEAAWEVAENYRSLAEARNRNFSQSIEEEVFFCGDKGEIQQLISILLDNAVRYSNENGKIDLSIHEKHGKILMDVSNSCDSVPAGNLNRLFDRFYRPDESRSKYTGGSGIGLSIAKAIAEQHGGSIRVKSEDDDIISFHVVL